MIMYLKNVAGFRLDYFKGMSYDDIRVALMDDKEEEKKAEKAKVAGDDQVQERQAEIYKIDMDHASKVVTAASEPVTAATTTIAAVEPQVPAATITDAPVRVAAASTRRRKGVFIRDPEEESTIIIPADTKSKGKGKGIMIGLLQGVVLYDIRPIFKAKFNSNIAFLLKTKEHLEEEENRAIQSINETPAQKAAKRRKPDGQAQVWKNQRTVHGQAKVKSWKLLESCGVYIITYTTTQLILLVKRRYPLLRFTLDQMLNAVRLRVEEQSEISLELLRFIRQQHQEGQLE
nr:hypothetical protein [Tanacetum cinerariifolium]